MVKTFGHGSPQILYKKIQTSLWWPNAGAQPRLEAPGSQGMLPYPSPLRTVHESRLSHGSSPCCFVSMSLVVRMMTPPMHKHAVLLPIITAFMFGRDVMIVDRIPVVKRHFAQPAAKVLGVQHAFSLRFDGQDLQAPLFPLCPVCLQVRIHRRGLPGDLRASGNGRVLMPEKLGVLFGKDPLAIPNGAEVPLLDPLR